jgi:hypothetical protein
MIAQSPSRIDRACLILSISGMTRQTGLSVFLAAIAVGLSGCSAIISRAGSPPAPMATRVVVHVVAHDAKLIGTAVGGARVTIREAASGRFLAEGRQEGGTGDTRQIMQEPRSRGAPVFTAPTGAHYEATVTIAEPTMVEVTAEGPLDYPDQMVRTAKRLLLLPGHDVTGDGIVLELHGYVVDLLAPDTTAVLPASGIAVRARVRMLCSCPTQPGGMWEVGEVTARLERDGVVVRETRLAYAGEPSTYAGQLPAVEAGRYALVVVAASEQSVNFGMVQRWVTVGR